MVKDANMGSPSNFSFLLLPAAFLYLCLSASGELSTQRRLLFFFDKIEVNGEVDVFLGEGKRNREATVYADSEIIDSVITRVRDKTLYLEANNTYELARRLPFLKLNAKRKFPVEIIVSIDKLKEIRVHGASNLTSTGLSSGNLSIFSTSSGKLHLENLDCPTLLLRHEGDGTIVLKGERVSQLKAQILGDGSLRGEDLLVERATLIHKGKGFAHLSPQAWLDARMHGPGNLLLHKKPEKMVVDQAGEGTIIDILGDSLPLLDHNATHPQLKKGIRERETKN
jgi:hypothetical protein